MSYRALFVQTYIVGAALFGSVLVSATAQAQAPGCCEGGSAFGANAWTAGNHWAGWGVAAPVFDPSDTWPAEAESQAGLKDEPAPYWWTHGELEIGGRDFVNNPTVGGQIYGNTPGNPPGYVHLDQQSLAKYYEYSIVAPGAFGGGHVAMGSSDGLYQLDLWANNVASNFAGFSDQAYTLEASKAGEHYLTVSWDQTPHIYSTSAQTPFLGVGTNNLTWQGALLPGGPTGNSGNYNGVYSYLHPIDLGIERDTISFAYRWTPDFGGGGWKDSALSQYDFNTWYSHTDRNGTQAAGVVELDGFNPTQVPAPVDDTTQNFGVSGERIGNTPWGKYTFKLGYAGSVYTDNISSYTVQNPFTPTSGICATPTTSAQGTINCKAALLSTPPSNEMNSISGTMTADLPYKTHYAGTLSYTDMTQNQTFLDMTNNPNAANTGIQGYTSVPWNQYNTGFINGNLLRPVTSLNGDIQEILSNNVLTTQITPDLTSKWSYRFYDFDNGTPNIAFPCWVSYDGTGYVPSSGSTGTHYPCGGSESAIQSLSISYMKQDVGSELNWRPDREWNFNAAYGFERYDYVQADVNATNESSGKLSADYRPFSWFDARLSGYVADRRYETYNYDDFVVPTQFPANIPCSGVSPTNCPGGYYVTQTAFEYSPAYRQFMYDNRDETKLNFLANITVFRGVTVSPSVKYQDDYYGINPNYNLGVASNGSVSWGVDVAYVPHPDLSFALSYYEEFYNTLAYAQSCQPNGSHGACTGAATGGVVTPATLVTTNDKEIVNTVTAAMSYVIIPGRLTLDLRGSVSDGLDSQVIANCTSGCPLPNNTTLLSHVEADLIYKFDPALLSDTGFKDMKLKLRYAWERNMVTNWQNDPIAPVTSSISTGALFMDYDNPNYNVQAVSASLIVKW
jgi:MtrB/PioB family decaheme-associated outer membrane protein